jgi:hypothetical protein
MRKFLFFLIALSIIKTSIAQDSTQKCGTQDMDTAEFKQLAWFDDNQVLETYLDSIGYPSSGGSGIQNIVENNIRYWIPVKFWIYRGDNGIYMGVLLFNIKN